MEEGKPSVKQLLFGTEEQPPAALSLRTGCFTERLRGAKLEAIEFDGHVAEHLLGLPGSTSLDAALAQRSHIC